MVSRTLLIGVAVLIAVIAAYFLFFSTDFSFSQEYTSLQNALPSSLDLETYAFPLTAEEIPLADLQQAKTVLESRNASYQTNQSHEGLALKTFTSILLAKTKGSIALNELYLYLDSQDFSQATGESVCDSSFASDASTLFSTAAIELNAFENALGIFSTDFASYQAQTLLPSYIEWTRNDLTSERESLNMRIDDISLELQQLNEACAALESEA